VSTNAKDYLLKIDPSLYLDNIVIQETTTSKYGVCTLGDSVIIKFPKNEDILDQFVLDFDNTCHLLCLPNSDKIVEILERVKNEPTSFDIETNSLSPFHRGTKIIAFSIAFENGESFSFPTAAPYVNENLAEQFTDLMLQIIKTAKYLIMFNGNYDTNYLCHKFPELNYDEINFKSDPMIDAYIYSGASLREYNLAFLAKKYLQAKEWKGGPLAWLEENYSRKKDRTFDKVPPNILLPYARRDSYYTMQLYLFLREHIESEKLRDTVEFVKQRVGSVCYRMHSDAFWMDKFALDFLDIRYSSKASDAEDILKDILIDRMKTLDPNINEEGIRNDLNIDSPKQMSEILYDLLGIPVLERTTKTRAPKTGTAQVLKLSTFDPPVFASFNIHKKWEKNHGYLKNYIKYTTQIAGKPESDERVCAHAEFSVIGTRTGRLASSRPNGQNIAVGSGLKCVFCTPDRSIIINALYEDLMNKGMPTMLAHNCKNYTKEMQLIDILADQDIGDDDDDDEEIMDEDI
jgi:DNA polymerase-1